MKRLGFLFATFCLIYANVSLGVASAQHLNSDADFTVNVSAVGSYAFPVNGFNIITVSTTGAWTVTTGANAFYCQDINGTKQLLNKVRTDLTGISDTSFTANISNYSMIVSPCYRVVMATAASFTGSMVIQVHANTNGQLPIHN